ncbi:MAG: hypothetical protein U9Q15_00115 [Patescibacteria group bacterium]|nr:hypothetical protein [Patescibacteria group bacterium]
MHPDGSKSVVNPETNRTDIFMTDGSARQLDDDGNIISEYNGVSGEHVVYNEDGDVVERQVPDKYTFTADPEAGTWTRVDHSLKQTTSLSEDGSMSIHLEGESTTTVVRPDAVIETRETINGEQKITSTTQFDGGGNKQIMMYEYNGNGDLIDV